MALPMCFIIITANIDLSVASNLAMSTIAMGVLYEAGVPMPLAIIAALLIGTLGGLFNGILIGKLKLPALVATLGTYALYRGIGYSIIGDQTAKGFPSWFFWLGQGKMLGTRAPVSLGLFIVIAVIYGLVLHRTTFGRYIYAIGENELACRFSGINVDRIKIIIFTLSGLMSAAAGLVMASRFSSVRGDIALGFELDVITAVVLGGVNIMGGSGSMVGVVLALFVLGMVRFMMSLLNIRGQVQSIVVGALLITAILVPNAIRSIQTRRSVQHVEAT
jgi:rhamnose transport system permease protein